MGSGCLRTVAADLFTRKKSGKNTTFCSSTSSTPNRSARPPLVTTGSARRSRWPDTQLRPRGTLVQPQWPPRSRGPLGYFEIINHENSFGACEFVTSCHSGEQDGGKRAVPRATSLSPRKLLWGAGSVTWVFQLGVPGVKLAPRSPRGPRHLSPGVWGSRVCSAPLPFV